MYKCYFFLTSIRLIVIPHVYRPKQHMFCDKSYELIVNREKQIMILYLQ